jgi:hypothetical protein
MFHIKVIDFMRFICYDTECIKFLFDVLFGGGGGVINFASCR